MVLAGNSGPVALLVDHQVPGQPLFETPVEAVTDAALDYALGVQLVPAWHVLASPTAVRRHHILAER